MLKQPFRILPFLDPGWLVCVLWLAVVGWLTAAVPSQAQPAPAEKTGLKVGATAPDFELKAQDGQEHSLHDLLKKGPVALVFFRSADW
jgi:cytochrome oxidase Cu insertion factor (SCO1/SenC/PrrC family)